MITPKNITVVGATGQIGAPLVDLLTATGHQVTAASRSSGVDARTGAGVRQALAGADVVVDVLNSPSMEDVPALDFFTQSAATLLAAANDAGVQHYLVLSIVGVDELVGAGYLAGKHVQEELVAMSGLPYTIVRATQFHELTETITESLIIGERVHAPQALIQPVAAAEVVAALAEVSTGIPQNGVHEVGGPEKMTFAEMAGTVLAAQGKDLSVIVDPAATYFGTPIQQTSLVTGARAELASTTLADWLARR